MGPDADVLAFLRRCGLDETALGRLDALTVLLAELREANRSVNLTRITSENDFWVKHVADSLSIGIAFPRILCAPLRVADVGCGGGFPALPLAWANDALRVTGIESTRKKAQFVQSMSERLGLQSLRVVARQVREVARMPEHAGAYDMVVLRAVGNVDALIRDCRRLLVAGRDSHLVLYTTPKAVLELCSRCRREAVKCGLMLSATEPFALPAGAGARQFVVMTNA